MHCVSCERDLAGSQACLWNRKIVMCKGCVELANAAKALMEAELRQAEAKAMFWLEKHICEHGLLRQPDLKFVRGEDRWIPKT